MAGDEGHTVDEWVALSPHMPEFTYQMDGRASLCGVCMFSLYLCGFSLVTPLSPHSHMGVFPAVVLYMLQMVSSRAPYYCTKHNNGWMEVAD